MSVDTKLSGMLEHMYTTSLLPLSSKLCAQRCQTLQVMKLSDIELLDDRIIIQISSVLKQNRPGFHQEPITSQSYLTNNKLCLVSTIKIYLERPKNLNNEQTLLISAVKPH